MAETETDYMFRATNGEEFWYTAETLADATGLFLAEASPEERASYRVFEVGNALSLKEVKA